MTWEAETALVRDPLIDNWDFDSKPVAWPGQDFDPPDRTGDRSGPAIWLDFDTEYQASEYLAGGNNARLIQGQLVCGIVVEKVASHALLHHQNADTIEGYYKTASGQEIVFQVPEAILTDVYEWEQSWLRADWICPFLRFDSTGAVASVPLLHEDGTPVLDEEGNPIYTEGP